jgi:CheY-like chemotaxis protein
MTSARFILIDDDPISNMISRLTVEKVLGKIDIKVFTNAVIALDYIKTEYASATLNTTLLLDINMPVMTGWEFLEEFEKFPDNIKSSIAIYVLTSSLDPRDKVHSKDNVHVRDHLVKPLTADAMKTMQ